MSDILCVTNRGLCREDFLVRIQKIAEARPAGIILREKDLTEEEYRELARTTIQICDEYGTPCILHSFVNVAKELGVKAIHLPLPVLRTLSKEDREVFTMLGASCHSVEDAIESERIGCTYITAGHVFETDCKKGLPGRGLDFLQKVCESVAIPVYAIGGISEENFDKVIKVGANGVCVMSKAMTCEEPKKYFAAVKER
ncbi:MAG: thiamine phosphate synthase [Lachnospiraceae bacterium]|nr:thiamine phosphate synthase [Lachnospiraceae bacterium]